MNKAPFNDKRVRQAIAYTIDYNLIVEKLYSGFSEPLYGRPYLTPYAGFPGFSADAVDHLLFEYNPEKARALLDEAGVSELAATIDTISDTSDEAQAIAQMLGEIGIDISVRVWDSAVLNEEFRKGGRDMILETRGQGGRSPSGYDSAGQSDGAWNHSGCSNPVYDILVDASKAISDFSTKRQTLLMATYEIAMEDVPILWIHNPHVLEACRANVKNFTAHAIGGKVNLHRVDIE